MDLKKKVRAELRDLLAQKKIEQETQANLIIEVSSLREERENLQTIIESEKTRHQTSVDLLKQEASFLKQEKERLGKCVEDLTRKNREIEVTICENHRLILELEQSIQNLTISESSAKTQAREYISKLDAIKNEYEKQLTINNDKNLELKFIHGKILLAESNLSELKASINSKKQELDLLVKEHSRHSQWDEYLQDKESFLMEQFKLLGVKYIVYNSK